MGIIPVLLPFLAPLLCKGLWCLSLHGASCAGPGTEPSWACGVLANSSHKLKAWKSDWGFEERLGGYSFWDEHCACTFGQMHLSLWKCFNTALFTRAAKDFIFLIFQRQQIILHLILRQNSMLVWNMQTFVCKEDLNVPKILLKKGYHKDGRHREAGLQHCF